MKLSDRMKSNEPAAARPDPKRVAPPASSGLEGFKASVQEALYARLGPGLFDASLTPAQLTTQVSQEITALMDSSTVPLTVTERQELATAIVNDVVGLGPIDQFLADPDVTEIMVNSLDYIYVERHGVIERTTAQFTSVEHLRRVIDRIVGDVGRRIDESSPMVDARLPDGSRVNAIIPPLAVDGPALTIRKFAADPLPGRRPDRGSERLTRDRWPICSTLCVRARLNILISGGTGTGKTTLLNVLSQLHPRRRSASSRSRTPPSCSSSRSTSSASRAARPTSKGAARSRSATWCATRCACGPTGSSSARSAAPRRSTCSRR